MCFEALHGEVSMYIWFAVTPCDPVSTLLCGLFRWELSSYLSTAVEYIFGKKIDRHLNILTRSSPAVYLLTLSRWDKTEGRLLALSGSGDFLYCTEWDISQPACSSHHQPATSEHLQFTIETETYITFPWCTHFKEGGWTSCTLQKTLSACSFHPPSLKT